MLMNRRELLTRAGGGLGSLALSTMLGGPKSAAAQHSTASRHHEVKAKSVIWLFMNGGPSSIDLFDHKPELERLHGTPFPGKVKTLFPYPGPIMGSPFRFSRYGQSGATVSHVLPNIAQQVDKLTFLRACVSEEQNHVPACFVVNTGSRQPGSPTLGAWATYGLANESRNLPEFVVMYDHRSAPEGGSTLWHSGFLPGENQGVTFLPGDNPILYSRRPAGTTARQQRQQLDLLAQLNQEHAELYPHNSELDARLRSFEMAYRMQTAVPQLVDLSGESEYSQRLYGLDDPACQHFGRQCLLARRMVEEGLPFIQIYHGGYENNWDQHGGLAEGHASNCREIDRPIAGLLADLEQRGLLKSTLVVWGGEFGRGPTAQDRDGRDHNPYGFSMWLAGGGVKAGHSHGQTDEFGYLPVEGAVTMHDLHATILHLMGLDERRLTFRHDGREQTPTNGLGHVIEEILA